VLKSRAYDGVTINTPKFNTDLRTAKVHRWRVRAHLYLNQLNRLPRAKDWKDAQ
jgi:hypothetical protein